MSKVGLRRVVITARSWPAAIERDSGSVLRTKRPYVALQNEPHSDEIAVVDRCSCGKAPNHADGRGMNTSTTAASEMQVRMSAPPLFFGMPHNIAQALLRLGCQVVSRCCS